MSARSAPTRVGQTHSPDEIPDFTRCRWAAFALATLPGPVGSKSFPMPGVDGLGLDDNQCGSPVRPQPGQPNPQQAVSTTQTNAMAAIRTPQDQELMAQGKDFSFQRCPRSEAGWHGEK